MTFHGSLLHFFSSFPSFSLFWCLFILCLPGHIESDTLKSKDKKRSWRFSSRNYVAPRRSTNVVAHNLAKVLFYGSGGPIGSPSCHTNEL